MHIFTISAGLVGVCLTAVGLLRVLASHSRIETLGGKLLSADALLFLVCCLLSFWSFKIFNPRRRDNLRKVIDWLFLLALMFMVAVCTLVAYAVIQWAPSRCLVRSRQGRACATGGLWCLRVSWP